MRLDAGLRADERARAFKEGCRGSEFQPHPRHLCILRVRRVESVPHTQIAKPSAPCALEIERKLATNVLRGFRLREETPLALRYSLRSDGLSRESCGPCQKEHSCVVVPDAEPENLVNAA